MGYSVEYWHYYFWLAGHSQEPLGPKTERGQDSHTRREQTLRISGITPALGGWLAGSVVQEQELQTTQQN